MPPADPSPTRRSPLTVMVVVVGSVVGALALLVAVLLGWNAWRPPLAGDYAQLEQEASLTGDQLTALATVVGQAPAAVSAPGSEQVQRLGGSIELEVTRVQDQTAVLDRLRAADDPEVARQLQDLHTAVDDLDDYLGRYSTALLPLQAAGAACPEWDTTLDLAQGPSEEQIAGASASCQQQLRALAEVPDGAWRVFAAAHTAHIQDYAALAERVRSGDPAAAAELDGLHEQYLQRLQEASAALGQEVAARGEPAGTAVDELRTHAAERAAG